MQPPGALLPRGPQNILCSRHVARRTRRWAGSQASSPGHCGVPGLPRLLRTPVQIPISRANVTQPWKSQSAVQISHAEVQCTSIFFSNAEHTGAAGLSKGGEETRRVRGGGQNTYQEAERRGQGLGGSRELQSPARARRPPPPPPQ